MPRERGAARGCHRCCCHPPVTAFCKAGLVSPQPLLGFEPLVSPCRFPDAWELPRAIGMKRCPSSRPTLGGKVRNVIKFSGGLIGFSGYFQKVVSICFRFLFIWGKSKASCCWQRSLNMSKSHLTRSARGQGCVLLPQRPARRSGTLQAVPGAPNHAALLSGECQTHLQRSR